MYGIKLRVWGDYACFTRPEMKVERVSYDVMTPSAARAILEAIYWKPMLRWVVDKIYVLKPIQFTNVRRNELGSKISARNLVSAMQGGVVPSLFIEDDRKQRAATVLKNVEYVIVAHFRILSAGELTRKGCDASLLEGETDPAKHLAMFERRAEKGQCFKQPYLGCREFPAHFELVTGEIAQPPVPDGDLGFILFDIAFEDEMKPMFFRASLHQGCVHIPDPKSEEVKR
jgi:CRISPR-associated protein Cas5d